MSRGLHISFNFILESMRIMILDGGSIQNANHEENQSTYILDMDKASPTSWIWSPRVIQGNLKDLNTE